MNRSFFLCLAACRTRSSALVTRFRICVRGVLCWSNFSRPPPFAPPTPRPVAQSCSPASQLLRRGLTSHVRASSATAPRLPDAGQDGLPLLAGRGISQVPTRSLRAWWGLRPRQGVSASHDGAAHVAFGYTKSLGPTLTTRPALPLTWAGLSPAGSHQLPGALVSQFEV